MCGIAGLLWPESDAHRREETVRAMADALAYRGPDGWGTWVDEQGCAALSHRRLAILDLSEQGRQPMASKEGRYRLTFNGELYNFRELRQELAAEGESFSTECDTEVLLAAVCRWGLERSLKRFNGMFAFGLWDALERRLHLVRDRLGIKPLYYGRLGAAFAFGSELKALRVCPGFQAEIDRGSLGLFLRFSYVPTPYSIYRGIFKLPPGHHLIVEASQGLGSPRLRPFWEPETVALQGLRNPFSGSREEAIDLLEATLRKAVERRMVADVPLGAFLSGGIDSSTVVALMQAASPRPVKTFSIGFSIEGYDEAQHAKAVARHLGTDHTELYVQAEDARAVIPLLPTVYDEPFSDPSQIPTYLVSELARRDVTVSLSGDGGDELFWGYSRYHLAAALWQRIRKIPGPLRRLGAGTLEAVPTGALNILFGWLGPALSRYGRPGAAGDKLKKAAQLARMGSAEALYSSMVGHWRQPEDLVVGWEPRSMPLLEPEMARCLPSFLDRMPYLDQITYLPDDILTKVDRASMAHALEARVPILDHEVVELAWRLPMAWKRHGGQGKWILRQVLERHVPRELFDRPKMGFGVPVGDWLRGPLRPWAEELLSEDRLRREGYLVPEPVRRKWLEHLAGGRNWQYHLWDVLMFQAWLEGEG